MPRISVEEKVVDVDEYDAVEIDFDMATKVCVVVSVLSLPFGFHENNTNLFCLSSIALATLVVYVFFLRSTWICVRRYGA